MYRKIFILMLMLFFVSGCGEEPTDTSLVLYENNDFSMNIPANWEEIKNKEEVLPKANVGEIELAVSSNTSVGGFANNLLVLSTNLNKSTNSRDYSMLNNIGAETDYLEYLKLSSKEITFTDMDTSILYEFEARYNQESPKLKFLQTAHICNGTKAYFISLAIPTSVSDISKYVNFISSFSCK